LSEIPFNADISRIRAMEAVLPGHRPRELNVVNVAASVRPNKVVIEGGDDSPTVMPRTAYQLVYSDATVMLDSGLDKKTHDSFSDGAEEPYFMEAFVKLKTALDQARLIIFTHYHADHVAGVLTAENSGFLASKTIVTKETAELLVNKPHHPHLEISQKQAARFIQLEYLRYYPVAPGIVLIKSPGHSPDSQMVYIRLDSGKEFLHAVDSAWNMQNIHQVRGKAAPWVKENKAAILGQLKWLNSLLSSEPDITILVTHDNTRLKEVTANGSVGSELRL